MKEGFLGTAAPLVADLILALEITMGAGLLVGAWLARKGHFRRHAWCQSVIALLNNGGDCTDDDSFFSRSCASKNSGQARQGYYALATAHAVLGAFTELAALYILLSAGTHVLTERLRITKYKPWMRSVLVLWWGVLLLGTATYKRWYVPGLVRK